MFRRFNSNDVYFVITLLILVAGTIAAIPIAHRAGIVAERNEAALRASAPVPVPSGVSGYANIRYGFTVTYSTGVVRKIECYDAELGKRIRDEVCRQLGIE